MSRAHAWRRKPPPVVRELLEKVPESRFYVVREIGPTAFVIKGEVLPFLCGCGPFPLQWSTEFGSWAGSPSGRTPVHSMSRKELRRYSQRMEGAWRAHRGRIVGA